MSVFIILVSLFSFNLWAASEANCHLVQEGIYSNSSTPIHDIKFESLVDDFSLSSAKTLSFKLDHEFVRFTRMDIEIYKNTKMFFTGIKKTNNKTVSVQLDRTPKMALKEKAFTGNMIIKRPDQTLVYNFYCSF